MAQVFISYSRQDKDFVMQLRQALQAAGRDVWMDLHDIMPSAKWAQEISDAIASADTFISVITPDYVASPACKSELDQAVAERKRIIPIVARDVDPRQVDPALAALNFIFFRPTDNRNEAMQKLLFALNTDLDFWHKGSDIFVRARKWEANKKNPSFTLRGAELTDAEHWLSQSATKQPSPTPLQVDFITASRRATARRQRTTISLLSTGLIITLVLAVIASLFAVKLNLDNGTIKAQNTSLQASALAGRANVLLQNHQYDQALLVAAEANNVGENFDTRGAMLAALNASPYLETILHIGNGIDNFSSQSGRRVQYSADGKTLMFFTQSGISIWDMTTKQMRLQVTLDATNAAFAPNGQTFVTEDVNGNLTAWNAITGKQIKQFGTVQTDVFGFGPHTMMFSPDSSILAVDVCGQFDSSFNCIKSGVSLWNMQAMTNLGTLKLDYPAFDLSLAFSPDGQRLAVGLCSSIGSSSACGPISQVSTWDVAKLSRLHATKAPANAGDIYDIAYNPNGKTIIAAGPLGFACVLLCRDGALQAYEADTLKPASDPIIISNYAASHLAFTPDGNRIIFDEANNNFTSNAVSQGWHILDRFTNQVETALPFTVYNDPTNRPQDIATSSDGSHFVTCDIQGDLFLWHTKPTLGASIAVSQDYDASSAVAYTPDGAQLITATQDGRVVFWDAHTGNKVDAWPDNVEQGQQVTDITFTPDGRTLVLGDSLGNVTFWDLASKKQVGKTIIATNADATTNKDELPAVTRISFTPDGTRMLTDNASTRTMLWDVASGTLLHDFTSQFINKNDTTASIGATLSPDGRYLVLASQYSGVLLTEKDFAIYLVDAQTFKVVKQFATFPRRIDDMAFSPDGKLFAAVDTKGVFMVWNLATGNLLTTLQVPTAAYSRNTLFASFNGVQFSRDGKKLLATSANGLAIWDTQNQQPFIPSFVEPNYLSGTDINPDGSQVAVGWAGGPLTFLSFDAKSLQAQACEIANRNLTRDEWNQLIGSNPPYQKVCPNLP